jgi:formyl-CoA transferase
VGIAAAPIAHADRLTADSHLEQTGYFIDLLREFSGPQRQGGLAIIQDGRRLGARSPAPLLGEHTWEVLSSRLDMSRAQYDALVAQGVISFAPAPSRNNVAAPSQPET